MSEHPTSDELSKAKHDAGVSSSFLEFMSTSWAPEPVQVTGAHRVAEHTARRRAQVAEAFPGEWLVIPTGHEVVRSNDTHHLFRANTDFYWLTGSTEADQVLVIDPEGQSTLFLAPRSDNKTPAFMTNRVYGEAWVGPRLGLEETAALLAISTQPMAELEGVLGAAEHSKVRIVRGFDAKVDALVAERDEDKILVETLNELRLVKDSYELERLREACASSARGFEDVVRELAEAKKTSERYIEGTFYRRARVEGNYVGYHSICAASEHATTLHWWRNDGAVRDGDLLLLDAGVEHVELYTADITRTLPISGQYSPEQREIYDLVYAAQEAAISVTKPGASFLDPHNAAMEVLAKGLHDLGILPISVEESLNPEVAYHRRWTLHGVSHMLGLDVHDCASARNEMYRAGTFEVGNVFTIEPGLYFRTDDELVPARYRGIGVRIEDDIVVTEDGCENISAMLPRTADDVEAWMAKLLA